MKLNSLLILIFLFFNSSIVFAQFIVVVDIQYLIDNNSIYIKTIKAMEDSQSKYLNDFKKKEEDLTQMYEEIESSKLIINKNEIKLQIDNYNNLLNNFSNLVEEFNFHYKNQVILMREKMLKEIIILLENYAIENQVDLILDSTSYLIASNSVDITKEIEKLLNKVEIELEYGEFEKN